MRAIHVSVCVVPVHGALNLVTVGIAPIIFKFFMIIIPHWCSAPSPKGVNVSQPTPATTSGIGGPCPVGHYCLAQTPVPSPCPVGTYRDVEYGAQMSDCFDCSLGNYCGTQGLADDSGPCSPGFYCLVASDSPTPTGERA